MDKVQKAIFDAVDVVTAKKLKKLHYNYYIDGRVTAVSSGKYTVVSGANTYTNVPCRTGKTFKVGDVVQICVKNGDLSRKFIDDYAF